MADLKMQDRRLGKTKGIRIVETPCENPTRTRSPPLVPLNRSQTCQAPPWEQSLAKRLQRSSSDDALDRAKPRSVTGARKGGQRLQLPSFKLLGISSLGRSHSQEHSGGRQRNHERVPSTGVNGTRGTPNRSQTTSSSDNFLQPNLGVTPLLTPPEDQDSIKWNTRHPSGPAITSASAASEPKLEAAGTSRSAASGSTQKSAMLELGATTRSHQQSSSPQAPPDSSMASSGRVMGTWLRDGVSSTVSSAYTMQLEHVKTIFHALPCPLHEQGPPTPAFIPMVQAIQSGYQPGRRRNIEIIHAMPSKYSLLTIPTSPPTTPNVNTSEAQDYFNSGVFSQATTVPAFFLQNEETQKSIPSSPYPSVVPSSIHVSVVERYIPPSSPKELYDFFHYGATSVLVDRLCELSVNGSLMLTYPTKKGALSFKNVYMGPILEPLIRQMAIIHELSADIGSSLAKMEVIGYMMNVEEMKQKIVALCKELGQKSPNSAAFTIVHSDKGEFYPTRETWTEWYIQQEIERAKNVFVQYWKRGKHLPAGKDITAASMLRDVMSGIRSRDYGFEGPPRAGLEVGIFVIKRTR